MAVSVIVFVAHRVSGNTVPSSKWRKSCLTKVAEPTEMRGICAGIVLMPGDTLPLKVVRRQDRLKLENALSAPAPFTRLFAVVHGSLRNCYLLPIWVFNTPCCMSFCIQSLQLMISWHLQDKGVVLTKQCLGSYDEFAIELSTSPSEQPLLLLPLACT